MKKSCKVGVMTRTIFQKITSSLWVLCSFIPFFSGLGLIYVGNKYANAKWFMEGIAYELPSIIGVLAIQRIEVATVFFVIGSLVPYVAFIRSIMVDFTLQKQLDKTEMVSTSFEEKINSIIDSLWVLISFIPVFNGFGLIYKGKTNPNKSLLTEGIVYEIPWALGILSLAVPPLRFISLKLAIVFYFASVIRSVMVANEPKPLYANKDINAKEADFKLKSNGCKEEKINLKKESVDVKSEDGVVPAFQFYKKQFNELEEIYPQKEKNAMELIEKRFAPPQLTYNRFKRVVDDSHETFYSQLNAGYNILEMSNEYSTKVEDELKNKLLVLNSIIKGLDKLSEELILNITKLETESEDELDNLFEEFSRATGSVKAYN